MNFKEFNEPLNLTKDEIDKYLHWVSSITEEEEPARLGGVTISFELMPIGTRVIAHLSAIDEIQSPCLIIREL
jgi:hypothetical protein